MSDTFDLEVAAGGGNACVVRVRGRLDAKTSPQLVQLCSQTRGPGEHLVLNLAEVTFLSSSGVGAILALTERAHEEGAVVSLAAVSLAVNSVLQVLNLDRFLTIHPDEDVALRALGAA